MITYVNTSDKFLELVSWLQVTFVFGFDTETNVTDFAPDRYVDTMQMGVHGRKFIFRWHELDEGQQAYIRTVLASDRWVKIVHNALFDGGVLYRMGILLNRVHDTMLAEMVLHAGVLEEWPALDDLVWQYCRVYLDKDPEVRLSFGRLDEPLTERQIGYACEDVAYLVTIYRAQFLQLHEQDLEWVMGLENDSVLCYAEMQEEGVEMDTERWIGLQDKALPIVEAAKKKMDEWCLHPDLKDRVLGMQMVAEEDIIELPVNSPKFLLPLLQWIAPDLTGTSKPVVNKWLTRNMGVPTREQAIVLQAFAAGDKQPLCDYLLKHHRDELIRLGYITVAGTCLINWASQPQVLTLGQVLHKGLSGISKEDIGNTSHPFFLDLLEWRNASKLLTTYGEEFIRKHVQRDGKVRTKFNPIVSTGRASCSSPPMHQIPAKQPVGPIYRNCFMAPPGWDFDGSDFEGQELTILAHLSQDPVFLKCLHENRDIHSVSAELVYKQKWVDGALDNCMYYHSYVDKDGVLHPAGSQHKCKCPVHMEFRDKIKTIGFGLCYGLSKFGLAARLRITVKEADALMKEYFRAFPLIERLLIHLEQFGIKYGYAITPAPFFRKRFFPDWEQFREYIPRYLEGKMYHGGLGEIGRQARNHPIQGAGADLIKAATVLMRNKLIDSGEWGKTVKLVLQVHDEQQTMSRSDKTAWWKEEMHDCMLQAGRLVVPSGLLGAETKVSPVLEGRSRWTK